MGVKSWVGRTLGMAYRRRGQDCRHLGHLQVSAQSNEAGLLTGWHTASVLLWASWTRGRSLRSPGQSMWPGRSGVSRKRS